MEEVTEEPVTENEAKETDKFLIKNRESPTETCLTQESRHCFLGRPVFFKISFVYCFDPVYIYFSRLSEHI